jgi:ABC-type transport system involved in multi-copper enzyme maturation permease subunit
LLAAMSAMLVVFELFMILTARGYEESGGFRSVAALMPQFIEQWTNMMAASFRGFVLFGFLHPVVQVSLIAMAISIGSEPVAELESKFIDLLMARPMARATVVTRTIVILIVATLAAVGTLLAATIVGLRLLAPPGAVQPSRLVILSLSLNLALLVLTWGGIALAMAAGANRRGTAAASCGFLAFATFVLDYAGRFWRLVAPVSRISPFHYFDPFAMIGGEPLNLSHVATLAGMFAASAAVAFVLYSRRDL